jgi:ubiquinone/menaquinone biosynthesis C-methylase UbiE
LNAGHDDDPEGYDALRGGWLNERRVQHFADRVRSADPQVVVEIGSGTGRMLAELAGASPATRFIGVEPLDSYVEHGRRLLAEAGLTNVELHVGTGEQLAELVEGGIADLVISSDVLHHVGSLDQVASAARRVARPGARWVVVEPSAANPYVGAFQAFAPGERNFRTRRFLRSAQRAGWRLEERGRLFLIPSCIARPPRWLVACERRLEGLPVLGGAVRLELVAT